MVITEEKTFRVFFLLGTWTWTWTTNSYKKWFFFRDLQRWWSRCSELQGPGNPCRSVIGPGTVGSTIKRLDLHENPNTPLNHKSLGGGREWNSGQCFFFDTWLGEIRGCGRSAAYPAALVSRPTINWKPPTNSAIYPTAISQKFTSSQPGD